MADGNPFERNPVALRHERVDVVAGTLTVPVTLSAGDTLEIGSDGVATITRAPVEGEVVTDPCGERAYCGYDDEVTCTMRVGHAGDWHEETRHYPPVGGSDTELDEVVTRWRRVPR